jgi:hypothetical protein
LAIELLMASWFALSCFWRVALSAFDSPPASASATVTGSPASWSISVCCAFDTPSGVQAGVNVPASVAGSNLFPADPADAGHEGDGKREQRKRHPTFESVQRLPFLCGRRGPHTTARDSLSWPGYNAVFRTFPGLLWRFTRPW